MDYERPKPSQVAHQYIEEKERLALTVKRVREKRKLTQTEFAFYCGLSQSVICMIEKGKYEPGLHTLTKLGSGMNLTICELFWVGYVRY